MLPITLDEIKRDLMGYLERVKTGETIVILVNGEPVAEIKAVVHSGASLRPYALCAGEFRVPDDIDAPLPDEVIEQFENG